MAVAQAARGGEIANRRAARERSGVRLARYHRLQSWCTRDLLLAEELLLIAATAYATVGRY